MNRVMFLVVLLCLATGALLAQTADEIIDRADQAFELNRTYSRSTLTVTRDGRSQTPQVMEIYESEAADGTTRSLTVFAAPPRVAGTAYLMIGDDLWVRFASTGRIRKMSSSAKQNSAAGSDFSYADMGEGSSSFTEDYNASLAGTERLNGVSTWRIRLEPIHDDTDYERIVAWVSESDYLYLQIEFHQDGAPVKVMNLEDYRPVGPARFPFRVTMRSLVQDSVTVIETETVESDSPRVEERMFNQAYLRTIR